jgi:hypothetical protein
MNNNEARIKSFLLKYKKKFQKLNKKDIVADCFSCPMCEIDVPEDNCVEIYEHIAFLLNKEPKKIVARKGCKEVRKEMARLASSVIILAVE